MGLTKSFARNEDKSARSPHAVINVPNLGGINYDKLRKNVQTANQSPLRDFNPRRSHFGNSLTRSDGYNRHSSMSHASEGENG